MKTKFNDFTKDEIINIIKQSNSMIEVLNKIGYTANGSYAFRKLRRFCKENNIDLQNLNKKTKDIKIKKLLSCNTPIELDKVLIENSTYNRQSLKNRLLKEGLLKNVCYECNQLPFHNGKYLVLEIDHINGIRNDNRLENLRILCPNCHSQQQTTGNKRNKKISHKKREDYVKEEKNKWRDLENKNIEMVRNSNIDFTKFGWVQKVANLIAKHPQKINKWMKKYLPDILEKSFRKHTL
jgi:5-methylcytosine-specific restriction endonuclease McrA